MPNFTDYDRYAKKSASKQILASYIFYLSEIDAKNKKCIVRNVKMVGENSGERRNHMTRIQNSRNLVINNLFSHSGK